MPFTQYSFDKDANSFSRSEYYFQKNSITSNFRSSFSNVRYLLSYSLDQNSSEINPNDHENVTNFYDSLENLFPELYTLNVTKNFQTSFQSYLDYKSSLQDPFFLQSPNPIAVRYVSSNGTHYIERPPMQISVDFSINYSKTKKMVPVKIWIPWTIFVVSPNNSEAYMYFSDKSLSSLDQIYLNCPLPNIYNDARICYNSSLAGMDFLSTDIRYRYSYMFNEYFSGGWNLDLPSSLENILSKYFYSNYSASFPNYPALRNFFFPNLDKIKSSYPGRLSSAFIKKYIENNDIHSRYQSIYSNRNTFFRYFFIYMSSLNLDETLDFYKQVLSFSSDFDQSLYSVSSFEKIVKKTSISPMSNDQNYSNSMISDLNSFISVKSMDDPSTSRYDVSYIPFIFYSSFSQGSFATTHRLENFYYQYSHLIDQYFSLSSDNLYKYYIQVIFHSQDSPIDFSLQKYPSSFSTIDSYYKSLFPSYYDADSSTYTYQSILYSHNNFSTPIPSYQGAE